jgi:hypothetical protein
MAAPGITVVQTFTYRGAPEEWSNKFHFQGSAPANPADWRALADAFITLWKTTLTDVVSIVRVLCYENTDDPAVYTYTLASFSGNVPGTIVTGSSADLLESGDVAALLRWNTGRTSSRGKPVYLFKYLHGVMHASGARDTWRDTTVANTFAANVMASSGAWPGLADKTGTVPVGHLAETYLTTRTLKRRGRRPT